MNTENLNWDGMADAATDTHVFGRLDHPYVGDTLPNGATVIAYHHEVKEGHGYVLAYILKGVSGHEYATWRYAISANPTEYRDGILTYHGRYFGNIFAASKDFARRASVEEYSALCLHEDDDTL
jgi:hypothetical protein